MKMKVTYCFSCIIMLMLVLQSRADEAIEAGSEAPLYLHIFRASRGQKVVLDPEKIMDRTPATPPAALLSLKIELGRQFEVLDGDTKRVSGILTKDGESLHATLSGSFGSGFKFSGNLELEELVDPEVYWFSGALRRCRCVFSKGKDIEPFLKAQAEIDAKKLKEATERTRRNTEALEAATPEGGQGGECRE